MEDLTPYPPPSSSGPKLNLPMMYYVLAVVGTAAVVLALYNLFLIKLSAYQSTAAAARRMPSIVEVSGGRGGGGGGGNGSRQLRLASFKYKTRGEWSREEKIECAVCLCVVEEEEEVRELPRCKHVFHCTCIDMWLYSHRDCPLCRTSVSPMLLRDDTVDPADSSREGLLQFAASP